MIEKLNYKFIFFSEILLIKNLFSNTFEYLNLSIRFNFLKIFKIYNYKLKFWITLNLINNRKYLQNGLKYSKINVGWNGEKLRVNDESLKRNDDEIKVDVISHTDGYR